MRFISRTCLQVTVCLLLATTGRHASADPASSTTTADFAAQLVESSGLSGGFCVVVGIDNTQLGMDVARQGAFVVHHLCPDDSSRDQLRREIQSQGMYGPVAAITASPELLPYADNLINLIVIDVVNSRDRQEQLLDEVLRVLTPRGTAMLRTQPSDSSGQAGTQPLVGETDRLKAELQTDSSEQAGTNSLAERLRQSGIDAEEIEQSSGTWLRLQKPWPAEIDEWSHFLHGPDGNPVAEDRLVGPPKHFQWIAEPLWLRSHETDSSLSTLVTSQGRLFYIIDEAPISLPGDHSLPDKWSLVARDAFNGVLLWRVPIRRWGWREWKGSWFNTRPGDIPLNVQKRLVAVGDRVYVTLGYQAPVSELDAATGEILRTFEDTERTNEILFIDGTLILSVLDEAGVRVVAIDAESGKRLWTTPDSYRGSTTDYIKWNSRYGSTERPKLDPSLNTATDGNIVALIDGPDVVAVDLASGMEKWRKDFPEDAADRTAGRMQARDNLWIGTMIVRDGVVLHASPNRLAALSSEDGSILWTQPKRYIGHLWYEWKDVFVIDDLVWTWGSDLALESIGGEGPQKQRSLFPTTVNGYDLKTGRLVKEVPLGPIFKTHHHHRCYRNKATSRYILASRRGTEFVDLENAQHTIHNWVRGTCHVGMMPANGLQYAPPHPCKCYFEEKLNGLIALAPGDGGGKGRKSKVKEREKGSVERLGTASVGRLQQGPAFRQVTVSESATADLSGDWPMFRHDAMRTGAAATLVPDDANCLWRVSLQTKVSAPTVAAGRVFVAMIDQHQVACLNGADGRTLWTFTAGARVDSPPTCIQGRVYFGSADGWVYCLRAEDGQLAWRFRAVPDERWMGAFGQLESAWPIHGSVLVQNGTVYFAAGRTSQLDGGLHLYGLDAATGRERYYRLLDGPHYTIGDFDENFQLPMGALPDILMGDGQNIYLRTLAFDAALQPMRGAPKLQTSSGFLEDTYFKRSPWTYAGDYARLIVHDSRSAYYVRMFDSLRGLDPTVFFTPGSRGYLLFAKNIGESRNTWSQRVPIRIRAMAQAADRLIVSGPPDVVGSQDPLGAFEGRKGGLMVFLNATNGEKQAECQLPAPPVFNGIAVASGRLYLADEAGEVSCFGAAE